MRPLGLLSERARGRYLRAWDEEDGAEKNFIDFHADAGTHSLGHAPAEAHSVLREMVNRCTPIHVPNTFKFTLREVVAKRLCEAARMDRAFFSNSGAESVETAIKLARRYAHRRGMLSQRTIYVAQGGFHGRTLGALAASDGPQYYFEGFGPLPDGFSRFERIDDIPTNAAGILISPILSPTSDLKIYGKEWLSDLRAYASENGIALIFDEIQTGAGRTGAYLYSHRIGVMPDVVCLAKGMGMGAPVAATLATEEVASAFEPGTHYSTFGGNGVAMSFVNGMLDWLGYGREIGPNQEMPKGKSIKDKGAAVMGWLHRSGFATNIRGAGLMIAFDIDVPLPAFADACRHRGLLLPAFREGPGTVKIYPPLNIDEPMLGEALATMGAAYQEARRTK